MFHKIVIKIIQNRKYLLKFKIIKIYRKRKIIINYLVVA